MVFLAVLSQQGRADYLNINYLNNIYYHDEKHSEEEIDVNKLDDLYYGNIKRNKKAIVIKDPFESINRTILSFNNKIISNISHHINTKNKKNNKKRGKTSPEMIVKNFFQNVSLPISSINFILQQEPEKALTSVWRFFINSTLGIGGIFDIASSFEMENNNTSFNETFSKYNIDYGMYFVLPFIGPKTLKDIVCFALGFTFNPIFYFVSHKVILFLIINTYTIYSLLDYIDYNSLIMEDSLDSYTKLRSLYIQM